MSDTSERSDWLIFEACFLKFLKQVQDDKTKFVHLFLKVLSGITNAPVKFSIENFYVAIVQCRSFRQTSTVCRNELTSWDSFFFFRQKTNFARKKIH